MTSTLHPKATMYEELSTFGADPELTTGTRSDVIVRGRDEIEIENQSNTGTPAAGVHHVGTRAEVLAYCQNLLAAVIEADKLPA